MSYLPMMFSFAILHLVSSLAIKWTLFTNEMGKIYQWTVQKKEQRWKKKYWIIVYIIIHHTFRHLKIR